MPMNPVRSTVTVTERGSWDPTAGKGSVKASFSSGLDDRIEQVDVVMQVVDQDTFDTFVLGASFDIVIDLHVEV